MEFLISKSKKEDVVKEMKRGGDREQRRYFRYRRKDGERISCSWTSSASSLISMKKECEFLSRPPISFFQLLFDTFENLKFYKKNCEWTGENIP